MPTLVTLKNGSQEADFLVRAAMHSLNTLLAEDPIAFYELTMKARDSQHEFFGNAAQRLQALALVEPDGRLNGSVRNVVLSAVTGEGLDMQLGMPTVKDAP